MLAEQLVRDFPAFCSFFWCVKITAIRRSKTCYPFPPSVFSEATKMSRTFVTMVATAVVALVAGITTVALNDWFGSGDLVPYGIYCIPFALLAARTVDFVFGATRRLPAWLATACAFIAGILFGWLGTFVIAVALGRLFGAVSVPMLQTLCSTAAFIFSAAIVLRRAPLSRWVTLAVFGLALLSILASVGFLPAISLTTGNQHLTVLFFRHHPGDTDLKVSDPLVDGDSPPEILDKLDDTDLDLLRQTGLRGTLERLGSSSSNTTTWPRAKAMIIFTSPITEVMSLPQPKHCSIVYLQDNGDFRRVPDTAQTFERLIRIEHGSGGLNYTVEHSNGAQHGGDIEP